MEGQIVKQEETQALLSQVVESKVTRTELLDLIVDRVCQELTAEIENLEAQQKELDTNLSLSAAIDLTKFRTADAHVELDQHKEHTWKEGRSRYTATRYDLVIRVSLPLDVQLPKKYVEANARHAELEKQQDDLRSKRNRLVNGKTRARNEMVKHALENTPEGAKILEAIDGLKEHVKQKLLSAGNA